MEHKARSFMMKHMKSGGTILQASSLNRLKVIRRRPQSILGPVICCVQQSLKMYMSKFLPNLLVELAQTLKQCLQNCFCVLGRNPGNIQSTHCYAQQGLDCWNCQPGCVSAPSHSPLSFTEICGMHRVNKYLKISR